METAVMEKVTFEKWDMADHINTKEDVAAYLEAALEETDTAVQLAFINAVARSKGMAQIAKELNVTCESLAHSLSLDDEPSFNSIAKVLDNLGFQLTVKHRV